MSLLDLIKQFGTDLKNKISTGDLAQGVFKLYEIHCEMLVENEVDPDLTMADSEEPSISASAMMSESLCMLGSLTIELTLKHLFRAHNLIGESRSKPAYDGEHEHSIVKLLHSLEDKDETSKIFSDLKKFVEYNANKNDRIKGLDIFELADRGLRSFEVDIRYQFRNLETNKNEVPYVPDASVVVIFLKFFEINDMFSYLEKRWIDPRYIKLEEITNPEEDQS